MIQINGINKISPRTIGGGQVTYDDLLVNITLGRIPTGSAAAWTDIELITGFTTQLMAFQPNDYVDLFVQTNHSVALSTIIDNHIHWTMTVAGATSDNGKEIAWELKGCGAPIDGTWTTIGTITSPDYAIVTADGLKHKYFEIGHIADTFNTTVSTCFVIRLKRIAPADGTASTQLAFLVFNDCHVQLNSFGSLNETTKT